jgi:lactate dehydrogenase-like 2-hydroxyacid dehydrogenase
MWERVLTLDGAVCAILGFGGIGRATARLMRAFGARIHHERAPSAAEFQPPR